MKPDELLEAVRLHLHDRLGALDSRHTALAQTVHDLAEQHQAALKILEADLLEMDQGLAALRGRQDTAEAAAPTLVDDFQRVRVSCAALQQQLDDTQEMVIDADLHGLVENVQRLDLAALAAKERVEQLTRRLDEAQEEVRTALGGHSERQDHLLEEQQTFLGRVGEVAARVDAGLGQIQARVDQLLVEHADVWDEALTNLEAAHKAQVRETEGRLGERLDGLGATVERIAEARVQNADATDRVLAEQALEITAAQAALQALEISTGEQVRRVEDEMAERLTGWETDLRVARDTISQEIATVGAVHTDKWTALQARLDDQGRATEDRLTACDRALEVQQETLEALVESKATELHLRVEEASLQWAEALRETLQDELETLSTRRDENLQDALDDGLQRLRGDLLQRYTQAEPWARGGEDYKALAIVRHRGGLWQATTRTSAEPDPCSSAWMLLVEGIHEVGYEIDEGQAWTTIRLSSGLVQRAPVPYPAFRARGTYRAGEAYRQWDVVVRNRTTFLASQDTDSEPSNRNGHWIQLSDVVQGPKGPAGKDGRSVGREDLIALLPQITRMLADEMERRQQEHEDAAARHAAEQVRL